MVILEKKYQKEIFTIGIHGRLKAKKYLYSFFQQFDFWLWVCIMHKRCIYLEPGSSYSIRTIILLDYLAMH